MNRDPCDGSSFEIKGGNSKVRITILNRERARADADYWDGNWLNAKVDIEFPGFGANFAANIHAPEIVRFYDSLNRLQQSRNGEAKLELMEPCLDLRAKIEDVGHIAWNGLAQYPCGFGPQLTFSFESESSDLALVIESMAAMVQRFPVKGSPDV